MTNSYLVVVSNEGLSGSYCGRAVHFQVRVVIFPYKYLQDVQHLERRAERQLEKEENHWEEKRGWGLDYL